MKSTIITVLLCICIFLAGMGFDRYVIGLECKQVGIDTVYVPQQLIPPDKPVDVKPKFEVKYVNTSKPVNVDSIYEVAKSYWASLFADSGNHYAPAEYIAAVDTEFTRYKDDSTKVEIGVQFKSHIPLDPEGYFRFNKVNMIYPEVKITVQKKKTFWDWLIPKPSILAGFGYGHLNKVWDVWTGAGGSWELTE